MRSADLVLERVSRAFGPLVALDEVDLTVPAGSWVALMGANGAGKTTLLRLLAGLTLPSEGRVRVAGIDRRAAGAGIRAMLGYVGHESLLYAELTVRENLAFHADLHGLDRQVVEDVAARLDVTHALDRRARELSRGTTQRAALARALLHEPAVLLLDEPFTGLDLDSADRLAAILTDLHGRGRTLMLTVHDPAHAALAERLVVLHDGRVVADEPVTDADGITARVRAVGRGGGELAEVGR
ncbi:MAG: heme ABC exporter ATP-binding protein CcmA [Nitriliruptoraceae bacterium]